MKKVIIRYSTFILVFTFFMMGCEDRLDVEPRSELGDSFLAAIRSKPIPPGEISDEIQLVSNYGVEGNSKASFPNNPHWKVVICKLYASSSGSPYIHLGDFTVSKEIDFEEPEEVGIKPVSKKEEKR